MFKSCTQNTLWPDIVFKCISACSVCAAADVIFVSSFMTFSISINSTERAETTLPYDGPRSCLRHVRCLVVPSRAVLNRHSVRSAWSFAQWPTLRRFLHRSQGSADCVHFYDSYPVFSYYLCQGGVMRSRWFVYQSVCVQDFYYFFIIVLYCTSCVLTAWY